MWSLLIDQTGPFKHYQGSCDNIARVGYNGNESQLWMWDKSTEKPSQDRWTPASQPGRDHMLKDAWNSFEKSRLGLVQNRSVNPYILMSWKILLLIGQTREEKLPSISLACIFRDEEFHRACRPLLTFWGFQPISRAIYLASAAHPI